jgi:hypothetical protein
MQRRFELLFEVQQKRNTGLRLLFSKCRHFAFELVSGFDKFLDCPTQMTWYQENDGYEKRKTLPFLKHELHPEVDVSWNFWIVIDFGPGNGELRVRALFKKSGEFYEVRHGDGNHTFKISEGNFPAEAGEFYEFLYQDLKSFLERNPGEFSGTERRKPLGFLSTSPDT